MNYQHSLVLYSTWWNRKKVYNLPFKPACFCFSKTWNAYLFIYSLKRSRSHGKHGVRLPSHPPASRRSSPKRGAAAGAAGIARLPPGPAERQQHAAARCLLPAPARWRLWFWQELAAPGVGDFKDSFLFFCILYMGERMPVVRGGLENREDWNASLSPCIWGLWGCRDVLCTSRSYSHLVCGALTRL